MMYVRSYTVSCVAVMGLFFSQSVLFIVKPSHAAEYSRILPQGTLPADSRMRRREPLILIIHFNRSIHQRHGSYVERKSDDAFLLVQGFGPCRQKHH